MSNTEEFEEKNRVEGGTLYLVSTPIGNMADLSERAKKVLDGVDFIAAEDTRNTLKLLHLIGVSSPLLSYHDHNRKERGPQIIARLQAGESCALVTDAGTPAISDPGEDLVALAAEANIPVTAVPGCCAGITALTLSGLPTGRFTFEGFLPKDKTEHRERLSELRGERKTMILHESPHHLKITLSELSETLGAGRRVALCRELTKRNEEIIRTTLGEAALLYQTEEPRGEYVLVIEGNAAAPAESDGTEKGKIRAATFSPAEHVAYHEREGLSHGEALKAAARERGMSKNDLYRLLLAKKEQ